MVNLIKKTEIDIRQLCAGKTVTSECNEKLKKYFIKNETGKLIENRIEHTIANYKSAFQDISANLITLNTKTGNTSSSWVNYKFKNVPIRKILLNLKLIEKENAVSRLNILKELEKVGE